MSYRDDREALHHRVAQLEQQLDDARREGEAQGRGDAAARAATLEKKLAAMRSEVEAMGAELSALRGKTPPRSSRASLVVGAAFAAAAVAVVAALAVLQRESRAPRWTFEPPVVPPPSTSFLPVAPAPTQPVAAGSATATPSGTLRSTKARWNARVARANGLALRAGTACTVDATIVAKDTNALVDELAVQCGEQFLYRSSDPFSGMSETSNDAREVLGPADDRSTFHLAYRDIGARSGKRSQVDLDTTHRQAVVRRETIPPFEVELSIPMESTAGAPLSGPEQRLARTGKVIGVTGSSPVKVGAPCTFRAMPTGQDKACTADVRCGGVVLFPSTAPLSCTYDGTRPASFASDEPGVGLALDGSTLVVARKTFGASLALDEP